VTRLVVNRKRQTTAEFSDDNVDDEVATKTRQRL
jgi:hypothetical protein